MNKEFRDWLERELQLFKTANHLGTVDGLGMREVLEFVIKEYDELHKPVVIPKFVADYLEKAKKEINLLRVFEIANGLNELDVWRKEYNWIRLYHIDFARAWLDGYEVEETKYNVRVPHAEGDAYYYRLSNGKLFLSRWTEGERLRDGFFIFTEQEIKELLPDIPKKYWEEVE